jgi:hypothetical protein
LTQRPIDEVPTSADERAGQKRHRPRRRNQHMGSGGRQRAGKRR